MSNKKYLVLSEVSKKQSYIFKSNKLKDGTIKDNKGLHLGKTVGDSISEAGVFGDIKAKLRKMKFTLILVGIFVAIFLPYSIGLLKG